MLGGEIVVGDDTAGQDKFLDADLFSLPKNIETSFNRDLFQVNVRIISLFLVCMPQGRRRTSKAEAGVAARPTRGAAT